MAVRFVNSRIFFGGKTLYLIEIIKKMGEIFSEYWYNFLVEGVGTTLILSLITVSCGAVLGALLAIMKMSKFKPIGWIITAFVEVVRGTPLLLQLYIGYFLLPEILPFLDLNEFWSVALALILNSAAYVSEIIRSGIEAVDKGQTEAARSLGLNGATTMIQIVLPQAIKNILPALCNEFITIIKETSLASTFFVGELMTQYHKIVGKTHNSLPILMIIGIIYFVLNFVLSKGLSVFERRMKASA